MNNSRIFSSCMYFQGCCISLVGTAIQRLNVLDVEYLEKNACHSFLFSLNHVRWSLWDCMRLEAIMIVMTNAFSIHVVVREVAIEFL